MKTRLHRLAAGVTSMVIVTTALSGCGLIGGDSMEFTAEFTDSAGLFVGNDVGVRGVTVGEVTEIEPQGASVLVTVKVTDDDVSIPADVKALIVSRSVATDRYVELAPAYTGGATLSDGAKIPLVRTETPVDFDEVLDALNEFSVGIAGEDDTALAVRRFLRVGAEILGPNGVGLNEAITNLGEAVNAISGQKDNIVGTMNSLDTLASELVENRATVQQFIDSVAATTQFLASERNNFRQALTKLNRTVTVIAEFAERNKEKLKGTVGDVADVSDIILSREAQIGEFITTFPTALENLRRAQVPTGLLIRAPLGDLLSGTLTGELCAALQAEGLCDIVNGTIVGPLAELLGDLVGGGLGGGLGGLLGRTGEGR